ncbi:MAG: efflux RND transporter periplasmic adaptor subunit [Planctomycetota bacterium]|jgi:Cu(I)/Ag(I) efflux system membrane fusion protein
MTTTNDRTGLPWKPLSLGIIIGIVLVLVLQWSPHDSHEGHDHGTKAGATQEAGKKQMYVCPMMCVAPQPEPGRCPVCGMDLVPMPDEMAGGDGDLPQLSMSKAAKMLAEVETGVVERRFADLELRLSGKVDFDETRVKAISAWVPGRLEKVHVDNTGTLVRKGDPLLTVYSRELNKEKGIYLAQVKGSQTRAGTAEARRQDRWVKAARARLLLMGLTEEQIEAIEKRKEPEYTEDILAPLSGTVVKKNATEGMYVKEGTALYTVADLSRVWVWLDAYESDLAKLRYGQKVKIRTEAFAGEEFDGWVSFIEPVLNAMTRITRVRVVVDNPGSRLKPNMFVRAMLKVRLGEGGKVVPDPDLADKWISPRHPEIISDTPGLCTVCDIPLLRAQELGYASSDPATAPLVVPVTAVLYTGTRGVVYRKVPNKEKATFEGIHVELGQRAGDRYIVRSGLNEGDEIAVNGAFRIDSALQLMARPSMMRPLHAPTPSQDEESTGSMETEGEVAPLEVPAAFRSALAKAVATYYSIQQALGKDNLDGAKAGAMAFADATAAISTKDLTEEASVVWQDLQQRFTAVTGVMAGQDDLEEFRGMFSPLSSSLEEAVRTFGPLPGITVRRAFCPMAFDNNGGYWLQAEEGILNPYEGSRMPNCGMIKETIGKKVQ